MNQDSLDRCANLARVAETAPESGARSKIQVCVRHHDHRVFATELKTDWDQMFRSRGHDFLAGGNASRENNLVRLLLDHRCANRAIADDGLNDVLGKTRLFAELLDSQADQRSDFAWFENHG